ncbi:hypothetical protein [Methanosphaerula palustris]|uniref:Uncharacterized protein n=1 Tax=Methanosphaerula palustris (strain ATCC BAA-1556 / DSM 19958 / E1-9c) TaxID=521011 RepID=B8GJS1_METPE|nr:hypothetical protein [Methanosphaerula palustris]ACL15725.1 hypothetical protein Mpal_0343 [Methanosphaerula palustris E1-9c]
MVCIAGSFLPAAGENKTTTPFLTGQLPVKVRAQGLVSTIPGDIPILFTGFFENISGQMWGRQ